MKHILHDTASRRRDEPCKPRKERPNKSPRIQAYVIGLRGRISRDEEPRNKAAKSEAAKRSREESRDEETRTESREEPRAESREQRSRDEEPRNEAATRSREESRATPRRSRKPHRCRRSRRKPNRSLDASHLSLRGRVEISSSTSLI